MSEMLDKWMKRKSEQQMLEAFVRDPMESYRIFQGNCCDRGITGEELLVDLVTKLQLRVVKLEAEINATPLGER
jgi:hypothetical protein